MRIFNFKVPNDKKDDEFKFEVSRQQFVAKVLLFLGFPTIAYFITEDFLEKKGIDYLQCLMFIVLIGLLIALWKPAEEKRKYVACRTWLNLFIVLFVIKFIYEILVQKFFFSTYWCYIFPMLVFFVMGLKEALICTLVFYGGIAFSLFYSDFQPISLGELKLRFLITFSLVSIASFLSAYAVSRDQQRLLDHQRTLANEINERQFAEKALQGSKEEANRIAQENTIMAEIGRIISSSLNIDEVYDRFTEEVRKLIPFDRIVINLTDFKNNTSTTAYAAGIDVQGRQAGDVFSLAGSIHDYIITTRSSVLIQTEDEVEVLSRFPALLSTFRAGFRSMLSIPLISKDQVIGVLHIRSTKSNAYTERDVKLAERVGNQIAGAIANAQLFAERERSEEALRKSEEKFRELYDDAPVGYHEFDTEGRITRVNRTELEMLRYTGEEMLGRYVWDFIVEEVSREAVKAKLAGKSPPGRSFERTYRRKDGTTFPVLIEDRLIKDGEGRITGIRTTIQDITERKRAEETIQRSEEEARRLAQENAVMAEVGRIISSTLSIEEVYEHFAQEVHKLIPFDLIVINTVNLQNRTSTTAYIAGVDVPGRRAGDTVFLEGTATEECVRTRSALLIQAENIEEWSNRFPKLLPTFEAGLRSVIFVPLLSKDQVIGVLSLRRTKPNAYAERDLKLAERVGNEIAGAIANAQLFAERVRAEQKAKSLEEQLLQSQKMKAIGRLTGGIAHDFNNLLTVIKGYSQLLLLKLKEGDPLKASIQEIQKASQRAADLTQQLLAFSRRQILEFKILNLNTILRDMDKMLRRILGEDIELVTLLTEDLGRIKTDPSQIEQMILNLVVNARDAMPSGGKLTIETANVEMDEKYIHSHIGVKPGRYVMLSVSDTGVGMTPELKEHLFEPFFTTKEKGKGTGLGLSTVYGIIKQSEGDIRVYSEPGHGTTFKIYLPRVDEEPSALLRGDDKKSQSKGTETVLLVEDELSVRGLAVQVLRENGYNVLEAANGTEALRLIEEYAEEIHLLLTDVVMPQMGGKELADRLKPKRPEIKVLFTSGYTDNTIVHHGVLDPGVLFLQKPFSPEALLHKVREALDK